MKKLSFVILLGGLSSVCFSQGVFNQKGAWIKNQLKQIALFEIYIKDLKKGYDIAKKGLSLIGDIKNGDFNLHLDKFDALVAINPAVRRYSMGIQILLLRAAIRRLAPDNADPYIHSVFSNLLAGCSADAEQLNKLLTAGNYSLTDDERIERIDDLYADMQDKYAFAKSFANDIRVLSVQQLKEKNEVKTSRLLNNIQP